jgi:hypothetical protein
VYEFALYLKATQNAEAASFTDPHYYQLLLPIFFSDEQLAS